MVRRFWPDALIVLAAVVVAVDVAGQDGPALAGPALGLSVLALLARRVAPLAAPAALWVVAGAVSFADGSLVVGSATLYAVGLTCAFLLGGVRDPARARVGLAVILAGALAIALNDPGRGGADVVSVPAVFAAAWLAGQLRRAAEQRALHAEREREAAARLAVAEERARIARELHDVVAHAMSVMVLQVGAVRLRLPPARADDAEALQGVERTGRSALTEMRRLLGALRRDDEEAELAPQPGLGALDGLLDQVRAAGLPVRLEVRGEPVALPEALDLSAYRIVQEGLTNALKHAGAEQADVLVGYEPGELRLEVRDDGRGADGGDGLGHGLAGIGERVKIYGGEMTAGRANGGGFVLRTRLPL